MKSFHKQKTQLKVFNQAQIWLTCNLLCYVGLIQPKRHPPKTILTQCRNKTYFFVFLVWDLRLPTAPTDLEHNPSLRGRASQHGLALYRSATQQVVLQMGSGSTGTQNCTPQMYAQCAWYVAVLPLKYSGPRREVSMLLPCEDATSRYSTLMSVEV